jgi:hypothetical protein
VGGTETPVGGRVPVAVRGIATGMRVEAQVSGRQAGEPILQVRGGAAGGGLRRVARTRGWVAAVRREAGADGVSSGGAVRREADAGR